MVEADNVEGILMGSVQISPALSDTAQIRSAVFALNTNQTAATYDLCTCTVGDIMIISAVPYMAAAVTGLVSVSIQSNDTTAVVILSAGNGILANLTAGTSLAPATTRFVLRATKKLQYTIVGTGTGGGMSLAVEYRPLASGALLS